MQKEANLVRFLVCCLGLILVNCSPAQRRNDGVKQDKVGDTIQKNVEINKNAKVKLCEGDIVCDEDDSQLSKRGAALKIHLWETKVIPYELFGECPRDVASRIEDAMHEIENGTCIKFVKRTTETFWIYFTTASSGCWSYLGRQKPKQKLNLATGCLRHAIIVHEILHAVGFHHEQTRPDRDQYVKIIWKNIKAEKQHNFDKQTDEIIDMLRKPYDYGSVMHYGGLYFSKNGEQTIIPRHQSGDALIGQRERISMTDFYEINAIYDCSGPSHGWNAWSGFGPCDFSCIKQRERYCAESDRDNCPNANKHGVEMDEQKCSINECYGIGTFKTYPERSLLLTMDKAYARLNRLTFCLWMKVSDQNQKHTKRMIKIEDIAIGLKNLKSIVYWIGNKMWDTKVSIKLNNWHHICLTWENSEGHTALYLDGTLRALGNMKKSHVIKWRGWEIELISFAGEVSSMNVWNRTLQKFELLHMATKCKRILSGIVLSWNDILSEYKKYPSYWFRWPPQESIIQSIACPSPSVNFTEIINKINWYGSTFLITPEKNKPPAAYMTSFTLCLWISASDEIPRLSQIIIIEYVSDHADKIAIGLKNRKSILYWIGDERWDTGVSINLNNWHHICVTWNSSEGHTALYLDGTQHARVNMKKSHVSLKKSFRIKIPEYYVGQISDINLWKRVLPSSEIVQIEHICKLIISGSVLRWAELLDRLQGDQYREFAKCPSWLKTATNNIQFPRESTTDYILVKRKLPSMTSLTVCLWMIAPVYNQIDHRTMISYAVPGTDNEILLDNPESLLFWIGSSQWETKVSTNDGNWHHICATWDNSYGQTELYQDGVRRARGMYLKKGYETKASGSLIIGQEQDRVGGGFVESQSYVGEMTEINIWNRVLWEIEIAEMSKTCTSDAPGKVLTWDDVKAGIRHGEVAIVPSLCKP